MGHDRGVPDLHRDPERLRAHAARAEELADLLRTRGRGPAVPSWSRSVRRTAVIEGVDEVAAAVASAADRLSELARELRAAAYAAEAADHAAGRNLRRREAEQ